MLILSGPANAVTVSVLSISDVTQGSPVSFLLNVDLDTNERIPITNINIQVKNATSGSVVGNYSFEISGYVISGKSNVSITLLNNSATYSNGTLYGYGYGSGNNFSALNAGYGYGYGYETSLAGGEIYFNITINDTNIINSPGNYVVEAFVYTGESTKPYFSTVSATSFSVNSGDSTPPVITLNRPIQNEIYSVTNGSSGYGRFVLSYNVSDDSGFQNVEFNLSYNTFIAGNPPYLNSNTTLSDANYQNNSIALKDGTYSLVIYANDTNGTTARVSREFIVSSSYYSSLNTTNSTLVSNQTVLAGNNTLANSTINGSSYVINCTITNNSVVVNATVNRTIVQNSSVENSTIVDSTIQSGSIINASSILTNSTITRSVLNNVVITNVTAVNTTLINASVFNATIINNVIASGTNATIILNESSLTVNFTNVYRSINISDLIDAVNVTNVSSVTADRPKEVVSNSSGGYSVTVDVNQAINGITVKAALVGINPHGKPLPNMASANYFYIEASGFNASLKNATINMTMNGSFTGAWLMYFNNGTNEWEYVNKSPNLVTKTGSVITANVTHFSVFGLQGYTEPSTSPSTGGGAGGGGGVAIISENRFEVSLGILGPGEQSEHDIIGHKIFKKLTIKAKNFIGGSIIRGYTVSQPDGVPYPSGIVYNYLDVRTNIEDREIDFIEWSFGVEKSWIEENNIDPDSILLLRYSNFKWYKLKTDKESEDTENIYYRATSPGFSYLVITGEERSIAIPPIFPPITGKPPGEVIPPEEVVPEVPSIEVEPTEEEPGVGQPEEKEPSGINKFLILIGILAGILLLAGLLLYIFREDPRIRELFDWFR